MQESLQAYVENNIKELKRIISTIKILKEQIKRKKNSLLRTKELFENGFIDSIEYKRISTSLQKEINELETKLYEYIGIASDILEEIKKLLNFEESTKKTFSRSIIQINPIEVEPVIKEAEQTVTSLKPPEEVLRPKTRPEIKVGKKFLGIKKFLISDKDKNKKREKDQKVKIRLRKKKFDVSYRQYIIKLSNRLFGKITDYIIRNFPEVYTFVYESLKKAGVRITVRTYLSTILIMFTFGIIPAVLLSIIFLHQPVFVFLVFVAIVTSFVLFVLYYPEYLRKERANEIRSLLPFVIIHMASLSRSGLDPKSIFKIIAETREYKSLAEEFQKLVDYIEMGMGLSDAIRHIADNTPSQEFREFLEGLLLTLQSGASLKEFLDISAESAIIHYRALNQKFIQTIKTFSDIYVGMVITMPMILVSIIIMLASLASEVFGLSIPLVTFLLVYVVVPAVNIAMLLLISKIQPK